MPTDQPASTTRSPLRLLWGAIAVIALVALAANLYESGRTGELAWRDPLGPLGLLALSLAHLLDPRRGRWYRLLLALALTLIGADLLLTLADHA